MELNQVDRFHLQTLQALFHGLDEMLARGAEIIRAVPGGEGDFGGNEELFALVSRQGPGPCWTMTRTITPKGGRRRHHAPHIHA